jgi:hypothetical protein
VDELEGLPTPLRAFFEVLHVYDVVRLTVLFLFVLGVALYAVAIGNTAGRVLGLVLLALCALVAAKVVRSLRARRRAAL